jgi:chromosome segregation ATPase
MTEGLGAGDPRMAERIVGGARYGAGMADADTRIDSLKDDIRALSYSVLDLQAKASAHDAKFAEILITLDAHGAKLDSHDRRFDQVDARFDQVDARFDQVDARFDQVDGRLGQIDGRLGQIDGRLGQIDAQLGEILARLPAGPPSESSR